ncbi:MAG: UDP-2,3-diacylglucosamine diphosphatase [Flavobacteriales bacterium]
MILDQNKKIYFASDFHLGVPTYEISLEREKKIVRWLEMIRHDAAEIFLVGDIFDFWFEYKRAVPKGYTRLLGKISEITDSGIPVHVFTGNHDMWIFDYLPKECGVEVYRAPVKREWNHKTFLIGHGDGLGPGDHGYKFIKKVFANKVCQWLFARLHPNFGIWLANSMSGYSRSTTGDKDRIFLGEENEWLIIYCKEELQKEHTDYFIFGHRHLAMEIPLNENSKYINLGQWLSDNRYGVFDGKTVQLLAFEA